MTDRYLERIIAARVYDVARETPLELAQTLSRRLGRPVWLKREDQQPVFSFKLRGAYNKIASLSPEARARGVVTASAGNHAQGVALAAARFGIPSLIVMPVTTPQIKVDAVRALGGTPVLEGDHYDAAYQHARTLCARRRAVFIPAYDDPEVIAGQGTIGLEIIRQHSGPIDAVFVPVGGGGLIAGIAACFKALRPATRIIGVEPEDADAMRRSLKAGRRVRLAHVGLFADGVAVRQVGAETFRLARALVDQVITVSNDEICAAIKDVFEDTRSVMEPAGALGVAGVKRYLTKSRRQSGALVAIASGANMNFDRLRHVSERAEIGERREAILAVTIPERPGSFRRFCAQIGSHSITEFNYRYADPDRALVFVGLQMPNAASGVAEVAARLRRQGYACVDLTDNEMAKLHVRHLVGGRAPGPGERIFHFEFPERPRALRDFLQRMQSRWNITLFHYRNHGADFGRVLVGLEVPRPDERALKRFLEGLGYEYTEETTNPAYRLFLR